MATITQIRKAFDNSGRYPYAAGVLDCGHPCTIVLKPQRGACCKCGAENELQGAGKPTTCACGSQSFSLTFWPDPHNADHQISKIGDTVVCLACANEAAEVEWLKALDAGAVHHARFRYGSYWLYAHDPSSPSGFMLIRGVSATPAIDAVLAKKRISPLSPTERA